MRDISIELCSAVLIFRSQIFLELQAALIAETRSQVILASAFRAVCRELSAGHCHERSVRTFNNLEVANDKTIIERDGTEALQAIVRIFHQFDAYFRDFHVDSP